MIWRGTSRGLEIEARDVRNQVRGDRLRVAALRRVESFPRSLSPRTRFRPSSDVGHKAGDARSLVERMKSASLLEES